MAAATNGGSVIRTNTAGIFILAAITPPLTLIVVTFPKVDPRDPPSFKDHPDKHKFIQTNIVSTRSTTEANRAATALPQLPGTCLLIIKIQISQIATEIKCQLKSIITKKRISTITYQKDPSWSNS